MACNNLENYDYSKSTEEFYADDAEFVGKYAAHRAVLDYTYHKKYSIQRQIMQDRILDSFMGTIIFDNELTCEIPQQNWIVFTAGVMGSGKSHSLTWLSQHHIFPLTSFVRVDPDALRELLPENTNYNTLYPQNSAQYTQKEAGYLSEILTGYALSVGKNVLVEGTLRDGAWYTQYITRTKQNYPKLKFGLFHFNCTLNTVIARCEKRGRQTGRNVPLDVIERTLDQINNSMQILEEYMDVYYMFDSEGDMPVITYTTASDKQDLSYALLSQIFEMKCPIL